MHKTNALLFIPLIEALAAGKTIQFLSNDKGWIDMDSKYGIAWTHAPEKYRIKPDPPQEILVCPVRPRHCHVSGGRMSTPTYEDFMSAMTEALRNPDPMWLVREHIRVEALRTQRDVREAHEAEARLERITAKMGVQP